ncbi:ENDONUCLEASE 4 [Salix purpurea]|uniref:Aspergillus nuclease S1 n=1 Tax=Salix purpurea TaxID=77065 RepID=A0A9Q1AG21_SALPP|nr:ENDONUCLEASE 4 [Salix purpurea]
MFCDIGGRKHQAVQAEKKKKKIWDGIRGLLRLCALAFVLFVGLASISLPGALGWSKEGHMMTCRIAQNLLGPEAANAVENLYRWTSPLHFIDTPDNACTFDYSRDCVKDACVDGAIQNFTSQLLHYRDGTADRRYNLTEALLFLSHFMGDIHQPMHAGFTSDKGGNTVDLRWFRHKSNLHHVWDREIILTALKDFYDNDMVLLQEAIERNFSDGIWFDDVTSWKECDDLLSCPDKYATESINIACKWGYKGVKEGVNPSR